MVHSPLQKLVLSDHEYIAYHQLKGKPNRPGIIFLGGFMSDMDGTKATFLETFCAAKGYPFVRFDYMGHGKSSGNFIDGTISLWKENVLTILRTLTTGPQLLVGSSMGGWLMLLTALTSPERIAGLVGIASAPDFTETLIWDILPPHIRKHLLSAGLYQLESAYSDTPYPVTRKLIEDGRNHLLLQQPIPLTMPIHLIHGAQDHDVPAHISQTLHDQLLSTDKQITYIQEGDHRLSSPRDLSVIADAIDQMISRITTRQQAI